MVLGGLLVVPIGLIRAMAGQRAPVPTAPVDTQASAARARAIIMDIERSLGFDPIDREFEKLGYDIESRIPGTGKLRFIEVKGRVSGAPTITVTRNEILYSLNKPEDFILAIVEFIDAETPQGALPAPAVQPRAGFRRDQRQLRLCRIARKSRRTVMTSMTEKALLLRIRNKDKRNTCVRSRSYPATVRIAF